MFFGEKEIWIVFKGVRRMSDIFYDKSDVICVIFPFSILYTLFFWRGHWIIIRNSHITHKTTLKLYERCKVKEKLKF